MMRTMPGHKGAESLRSQLRVRYKRLKEKEMEMLNSVPPSLTPYYKEKVNSYFNNINSPN
jgi:hypothetical protein